MSRWLLAFFHVGVITWLALATQGAAAQGVDHLGLDPRGVHGWRVSAAPLEEQVGEATRGLVKGVRRTVRTSVAMMQRAFRSWGKYARRAARFVVLAAIVGLADRNLIAAWRIDGLRVLATYVPLMLYVYVRMLFDRRVPLLPKLLLIAAILYGTVRRDLIPDRSLFPGLIDDAILVAVAMRWLLSRCSDEVAESLALEAVNLRRRVLALQRARQR